ncbi:retrovirus-related pol polyprotein from transposon TNT 1-94 [Tanacetum coccineum]
MHTFYQRHPFRYHWTRDHPLEQLLGNTSQPVRTRRQLDTDGEMCMFVLTVSRAEPKNMKEAMADHAWIKAMQLELHQFKRLDVWELVNRPYGKNVINMKWLWKNKRDEENTIIRNKARLVAKGYHPHHPDKVYHLKKALYGFKQAPKAWYDELSNFLVSKDFSKCSIDPTLFTTKYGEDILLVQIYVDDIIFKSTNPNLSKKFEKLMHIKFEMSMIGELKFFLGLSIHQSPRGIFINQAKYIQEILKKNGMTSCDNTGTLMATKPLDVDLSETPVEQTKYRSMVGSLMYLTASCLDTHKSTSTRIKFLGGDKLFSWPSKKQDCTSMSTAEAEYVSLSACCAQVLWMRTQLTDYGFYFDKIPMYCDSKATIAISCNPVHHSRTKRIDVRYHFIKEQVERGIVELFFVGTEYQLADLFTKTFSQDRFQYLVRRLGMRCLTQAELEVLANESA